MCFIAGSNWNCNSFLYALKRTVSFIFIAIIRAHELTGLETTTAIANYCGGDDNLHSIQLLRTMNNGQ